MRKKSNKDYAVALYTLTRDLKKEDLDKVIQNFVVTLYKNGLLKQSENIIKEFIKYSKKQEGIVDIEITSARPLSETVLNKVKESFGKKVEATQKIDESIIGGIKVSTEDTVFDGSIRKQLALLKQSII